MHQGEARVAVHHNLLRRDPEDVGEEFPGFGQALLPHVVAAIRSIFGDEIGLFE
ncbi:hypothetical protein D9M68_827320 [compost metagenome]